ncbi:hypothetical protein ACIKTA_03425 [Hansschlegelia beijingensis]|uniref:hypothetical protein n=1 Tax=Hansschlegelia beijingensis TaxID=1133344 RepID=UPI003818D079
MAMRPWSGVVEDVPRIAADVRRGPERAGFAVGDGEAPWFQADIETYGAMILAPRLPKLDGLSALKKLMGANNLLPILILAGTFGADLCLRRAGKGLRRGCR